MLKPLAFAAMLAISASSATSAAARDKSRFESEIAGLTPQLETVLSGGFWVRGDKAGTYRLFIRAIGFERIRNELYLQWIRETSDPYHPAIIERTIPLPEIDGWRVTGQRFALVKKRWKIIVTAEREDFVSVEPRMQRRLFTIIPASDYSYKVVESR